MSNHIENPAYIVCPRCEGEGTHGPGHVFTQDDLDEQFGYEQDEVMADYRSGKYDVLCEECGGKRVVRGECPCDDCERGREELADMYQMERMERMMNC